MATRRGLGAFYDGDWATAAASFRSVAASADWGVIDAIVLLFQSMNGEHEAAWAAMDRALDEDLDGFRGLDGAFPVALACLAYAAAEIGHARAGERIRPMLERFRTRCLSIGPSIFWLNPTEFAIGRLELLAGRYGAAVTELHAAAARADELQIDFLRPWTRVELARALFRSGEPINLGAAEHVLAEAIELAEASGNAFALSEAAKLGAEMDGRQLSVVAPPHARVRQVRALAARSGRRALATLVRGADDRRLEERFLSPGRQRALLRAMARGFQPGAANGFEGTIAYELEPYAVAPPPDAPWRWAIRVNSDSAHLVEPAPLESAVTIHFGLADWVRVLAGEQDPLTAMAAGRCRVEGDIIVASLLEPMFSAPT